MSHQHRILFVECSFKHQTPLGSLPDFKSSPSPSEIVPQCRETTCHYCKGPVDVFKDKLVVRMVSEDESDDFRFKAACRTWAI